MTSTALLVRPEDRDRDIDLRDCNGKLLKPIYLLISNETCKGMWTKGIDKYISISIFLYTHFYRLKYAKIVKQFKISTWKFPSKTDILANGIGCLMSVIITNHYD